MRIILAAILALQLGGCAVVDRVREVWPRAHDPVMVSMWVDVNRAVAAVDCDTKDQGWAAANDQADRLAQYTEFRKDPQSKNMRGLQEHTAKMAQGASLAFCKLGKKTAEARLTAARSAWEGR